MLAGFLTKSPGGYDFIYEEDYFRNPEAPPISLTFPKTSREFHSDKLFPFFFGMLSEGEDKALQCRTLKIGERDHFTRLLKTAHSETIGSITVHEEPASV